MTTGCPGDGSCEQLQIHHTKRLTESEHRLGAIEREQRATHTTLEKVQSGISGMSSSIGDMAQLYGNVLVKISHVDESVESLVSVHKSICDKIGTIDETLRMRDKLCQMRHAEIDHVLVGITEDDFDTPTAVFDKMTGKQVKDVVMEERNERIKLQGQVEKLVHENIIHEREKTAVEVAKKSWQSETDKLVEQNHKSKVARLGLYGAIAVALITAAATITVAILRSGM